MTKPSPPPKSIPYDNANAIFLILAKTLFMMLLTWSWQDQNDHSEKVGHFVYINNNSFIQKQKSTGTFMYQVKCSIILFTSHAVINIFFIYHVN